MKFWTPQNTSIADLRIASITLKNISTPSRKSIASTAQSRGYNLRFQISLQGHTLCGSWMRRVVVATIDVQIGRIGKLGTVAAYPR